MHANLTRKKVDKPILYLLRQPAIRRIPPTHTRHSSTVSIEITTFAEQQAKSSETSPAFGGVNLLHIKRQVASLLGLIGQQGVFDQYTKHDISHINQMLHMLEWIVPDNTKTRMSSADWLMVTLSIYFHDLGMLVTKDEYASRRLSGFDAFCDQVLFVGDNGNDYRKKVERLGSDEAERFFYQEFVRHRHAERIRTWITGSGKDVLGVSHDALGAVSQLLEPLGPQFRRDLGFVCESHHLNDLGDTKKYKLSQPYGASDGETVNIQYAAVLLRTADLLHVTSDRTPSIEYRVINPTDPLSQQEWAKQMAVKRIRPKLGLNEDGIPDESALKDTVEVYAYFTKEDGFFGLTSYLSYAGDQLKKSNEWITATYKSKLSPYEFPWRKIDDSNIETEGFIKEAFEFKIDQVKILDLLTGHTLYNDTKVVLRELVQNAVDAIRLQHYPSPPSVDSRVVILWNSRDRVLTVRDNGTGMTQNMIDNFLLKVGLSRYQDPDFKKKYPNFSSISRFGIGVLSAFMIADGVEITTSHPDEEKARKLSLRSVHGKYLIKLLEKSDGLARPLGEHGTEFALTIRPTIDMSNVLETARRWIVIPKCNVTVRIDDNDPVTIGYPSLINALEVYAKSAGFELESSDSNGQIPEKSGKLRVQVREHISGGVALAYLVKWDDYFKEWSFLTATRNEERLRRACGTCVEGIRVEFESPGFNGLSIIALCNITGPNAPKTNVARSGLELTPERDNVLEQIYNLYCDHIKNEIAQLNNQRDFSLSWATAETTYLAGPLLATGQSNIGPLSKQIFDESVSKLPCLLVETNNDRVAMSPHEISSHKEFMTIDCALFRSAELLIKEVSSSASLSGLVAALKVRNLALPNTPVLCGVNPRNQLVASVFKNREVDKIVVYSEQRRVDLRWVETASPTRWRNVPSYARNYLVRNSRLFSDFHEYDEEDLVEERYNAIYPIVPFGKLTFESNSQELAVRAFGVVYLRPDTSVAEFANTWLDRAINPASEAEYIAACTVFSVLADCLKVSGLVEEPDKFIAQRLRKIEDMLPHTVQADSFHQSLEISNLVNFVGKTYWNTFDTSAWQRKN